MIFGKRKHGACRGCKDISHALEYEADMKNQMSLLQRKKIDEAEIITLKQMFEEYIEYSKANNTEHTYIRNKKKKDVILECIGDCTLAELTPQKIEKFKLALKNKNLSNATINRYYAVISKAFNIAIINHNINMLNPCKRVNKLKEDNQIMRYLTKEEEKKLLKKLPTYLKPIIICALTTGLRISNILNLKWESINFDMGFIEILKQENKGHKQIQIPLSKRLQKELKKIGIKEKGYVFVNPETNKPYVNIHKGFKEACKKAGIENLRIHDLRHTVGTRLMQNGADIMTVKQYLAHSNVTTTQKTSKTKNGSLAQLVEQRTENHII